MRLTHNTLTTNRGSADSFTGTVFVDAIAAAAPLSASAVHFAPSARTAWHTHPHGQTIWVTEGIGLCQRAGGPVEILRPGDRVFFEPHEDHWHGATPTRLMTHIAMQLADEDGIVVTWGRHVHGDEYPPAVVDGDC
jgi:quercetin dioxygenase-like cupin family protein